MTDQAAYIKKLERRIHNQRAQLAWYQSTWQSWCRSHWIRAIGGDPSKNYFLRRAIARRMKQG